MLREVWEQSAINQETMIVRRGNDSSTWNNTAGGWNKARSSWIALLHALGMTSELDLMCFGKVMKLIAADVAAWHRAVGHEMDPDIKVWNEIPFPWEVLSGDRSCTREMVEQACRKYNIDPVKNGWTAPRTETIVVTFKPTPELVHGVTVTNPQLAATLKKAGWFSGKRAEPLGEDDGTIRVYRDQHGFALGVEDKSGSETLDDS